MAKQPLPEHVQRDLKLKNKCRRAIKLLAETRRFSKSFLLVLDTVVERSRAGTGLLYAETGQETGRRSGCDHRTVTNALRAMVRLGVLELVAQDTRAVQAELIAAGLTAIAARINTSARYRRNLLRVNADWAGFQASRQRGVVQVALAESDYELARTAMARRNKPAVGDAASRTTV